VHVRSGARDPAATPARASDRAVRAVPRVPVVPAAAPGERARRLDGARRRRALDPADRKVATVALASAALVWVWVLASAAAFSRQQFPVQPGFAGQLWLDPWLRWDGGWYRDIAERGYFYRVGEQSSVAFFPAYPLSMRLLGPILGGAVPAGIAVSAASGFAAIVLFGRWCRARLDGVAAGFAVVALLVYPYSWYLHGVVYADALFLLCALGAFRLVEADRPVAAGVVGALAAASRPVGPAVVLGLAFVLLERRGALRTRTIALGHDRRGRRRQLRIPVALDRRRLQRRDYAVLGAGVGFGAYCGYLAVRFGDPFAFNTVQAAWDQRSGPHTWFKLSLMGLARGHLTDEWRYIVGCVIQGALMLAALVASPRIARRFGLGYGVFVFVLAFMPLAGSKDFQGLGRYLLAAFPVFALAGEWLAGRRPAHQRLILGASLAGLAFWSHLFARGFYVA